MRSINGDWLVSCTDRKMARVAREYALSHSDPQTEYGVGAVLLVDYEDSGANYHNIEERHKHLYAACNINKSGMEFKMHAEQLALFQAILDANINGVHIGEGGASLEGMMVVTTESDLALKCGHCMQTIYPYVEEDMDYVAAKTVGKLDSQTFKWEYERHSFKEMWGDSYTDRRE